MKKILIALLMTFAGSTLAHANAKVVGNGGNTVVCKDDKSAIITTEVFDLYEGRVLRGLQYQEKNKPSADQATEIIASLAKSLGQKEESTGGLTSLLKRVRKNLIFLPSGTGLKPIPDGAEFILPKKCELIQTINFRDFDHVYVDTDVWATLSETQKAALLVHETIYWYLRDPGPKGNFVEVSSSRTRKAVALLFSGTKFLKLNDFIEGNGMKPIFCSTIDALESDRPSTSFYAFPAKDGKIAFQFTRILDRHLLTRSALSTQVVDLSKWPLAVKDQPWTASGSPDSLMESDFHIDIRWWPLSPEHNRIFVRDNEGNSATESFTCSFTKL